MRRAGPEGHGGGVPAGVVRAAVVTVSDRCAAGEAVDGSGPVLVAGLLLIAIWPFTRLVHAFSAPLAYVTRPYVVYRDRGPHDGGNRPARRGWEKVG